MVKVVKAARKTSKRKSLIVVAIGASAGGMRALKDFFSRVASEAHVCFVVVQHLDDDGKNLALESLQRISPFEVIELRNGSSLSAQKVFFVPPHKRVTFDQLKVRLTSATSTENKLSVIDTLFASVAKSYGDQSVGIILSGDASDGSKGIRLIAEHGGLTLAQSPQSAEHRSMPENGILTGVIDHILPAQELWEPIADFINFSAITKSSKKHLKDEIASGITSICEVLFLQTKHDFKHYKTSTLIKRIQRRLQVKQISSIADYIELLNADTEEVQTLFKDLLINVTSFFRDRESFNILKEQVLQSLIEKRKGDGKIRIWVAGCSTGEEPYTIAILMHELLEKFEKPPEVQIIATDMDDSALNVARRGVYSAAAVHQISPERLVRYFTKKNGSYHVKKELREMCLFSIHNLINDPPFSQIDLISCRNLLIYLGSHLQKKLFPVFHYALKPGGYLFLGTSETITSHRELFKPIDNRHRIAQRKATAIKLPPINTSVQNYLSHFGNSDKASEADINLVAQRILLDESPVRYAVVNDEGQILSSSAGVNKYIQFPEGSFQNNIVKLVSPSLCATLRSLFSTAKKQKRKISNNACSIKTEEGAERVEIIVQPMPQLGDLSELYWVAFHNLGFIQAKDLKIVRELDDQGLDLMDQLERELTTVRQELDKSIQDLEASNEELKSSNEELLSMNEELQSANEELETSKEEVQLVNDSLERANTDLENLLASTDIATLFLDSDFRIQNFTPQLSTIYNISRVDIGRPITDITSKAEEMPPVPSLTEVVKPDIKENDLKLKDGRRLIRRVSPYRNSDGEISGIVVTFIDVTNLRTLESLHRESEGRFQIMADTAPVLCWISGKNRERTWFNKGWIEYTGLSLEESLKQGWKKAVHPEDLARYLQIYNDNFDSRTPFHIEYRLKGQDGNYRWISARGVPRINPDGEFEGYIGACLDIHEQRMARDRLASNEKRLAMMIETSPSFMCLLRGPNHVFEQVNEQYLQLVGHRDVIGKSVVEALPEIAEQGFVELLDRVRSTGKPFIGTELAISLQPTPNSPLETRYVDFVYQPAGFLEGEDSGIFVHGVDVTEKVHAKNAIENERENFRNLFKQTPEMVCILKGPDHLFEFVNDAHIKVLGFDATGMTVRQAQPESVEVHGILDNVFQTGKTAELHEIPVTVTNRLRHFNLTYAARRDLDGTINGVMILGTEISSEVSAREKLKESEERYRTLFESVDQGFCVFKMIFDQAGKPVDYRFLETNPMFDKQTGLKNAVGKTARELVPNLDEFWFEAYGKVAKTGEAFRFEQEAPAMNRHFDVYAFRVGLPEQYRVGLLFSDVTERKLSENILRDTKKRYELATRATRDAIWDWNLATDEVFWNEAIHSEYGHPREVIKSNATWWYEHIHPEDRERVVHGIHEVIDSSQGQLWNDEYRYLKADGSYTPVNDRGFIERDSEGKAIRMIGAMEDITERKQSELALKEAKESAEKAQAAAEFASESKTRFLANMSHEIRTPLAAIIGFSDLLRPHFSDDKEVNSFIERISRNASHLGRLIDELLDLSKIEADKLELNASPIDLDSIIEDVASSMVLRAQDKGLDVEFLWSTHKPKLVNSDPVRLAQILTNVIGNAVKFTEQGKVEVEFSVDEEVLYVKVSDTGIGLTTDQQKIIFEPFMQADASVTRKYGGTGLGLALSKKLARLMGGDLVLKKSVFQKGSTFEISIPLILAGGSTQNLDSPKVAGAEQSLELLSGVKILVVDDSPDNRVIVRLFLKTAGAEVEEASNGEEGVQRALTEPFDIILMDIQMPIMDGYRAMEVLRQEEYPKPVVALTAHAFKEERDRSLSAGFAGYVTKPISKAHLLSTVSELVKKEEG